MGSVGDAHKMEENIESHKQKQRNGERSEIQFA